MEGLWQDMRYAARKLVRQPGFTVAALLTLALGIGANAVLFTLVNALLLRPPAGVASPDRLVSLYTQDFSSGNAGATSYADYEEFAKATDVFSSVTAYAVQVASSGTVASPVRVGLELASDTYFRTMGVSLRGRSFNTTESQTGAPVAVISDEYWKRQMGGASDAIGKTIMVNAKPLTVIGITQGGYRGATRGFATDVWLPFRTARAIGMSEIDYRSRGDRSLWVMARMQPKATVDQAQRRMRIVATQLFKSFPENWNTLNGGGRRITVVSERVARIPAPLRSQAYLFMALLAGIVGLVLLICCANVAGLMIARAAGLAREMGIRISIGASRARIARLLFVESVILSIAGAVIGLFATTWLMEVITHMLPRLPVPISIDLGVDTRVLLFTSFIALFSATLFGSAPAFRASRADPNLVIKTGAAPMQVGRRRISFRGALVGVQVASSVVLLVTALLFLRSMRSALTSDLGYKVDDMALFSLEPEPGYQPDDAEAQRVAMAAASLLRGTSGVSAVTWGNDAPLAGGGSRRGTTIQGYTPAKGEDREFHFMMVGPAYLSTLGVQIVKGRDLRDADRKGAAPVLVVNETFAKRFWNGEDPVGKRVSIDGGSVFAEVVGVARDAHLMDVGNGDIKPMMFFPMLQEGWWGTTLMARVPNLTPARITDLKQLLQTNMPRWVVRNERTLAKQAELSILPQRIASMVLSIFGGLALFLSAIGLYGVIAYAVTQRTQEFGIRMALGASTREVVQLMMNQGLRVIVIGALAGVAVTALAAQVLKSLLLGLSPMDPVSFIAAPALLVAVGCVATLLPARRAARVDPLKALRSE
jgi:predicted permease